MKKILIVEDEATNAKILGFHIKAFFDLIEEDKYKIDVAVNGFEAFGMHYNTHYDLILLDVKMPKCDGLKFLTMLRQAKEIHQPIVSMVTALGDEGYINLFRQKGANSFLIKPYDKDKIYMILEHSFKIKIKNLEDGTIEKIEVKDYSEFEDDGFDFDFDFEDDFVTEDDANARSEANASHIKVPASEFIAEYDNIEYILEDIEDIDLILDLLVTTLDVDNINDSMANIDECLRKYATFLNSLTTFGELSSTITLMNRQLHEVDFDAMDDKKKFYVIEVIRAILEDLQNWKEFVFVQQTANDVYYINASIITNNMQLQNMIKN